MANRNGYGATPPVTETCLSFRQFDAADGYRGRRRRKGRQIWKRKTDLKCALAMVASEARLVVNDTVCCQLLHQIHSLIARLTLLLCAGKWRHHSTRLSSHKKPAPKKGKKNKRAAFEAFLFFCSCFPFTTAATAAKTGATRRLSGSRGGRRAQSQKRRSSTTRKPLEHDRLQAQSTIVWTPPILIHETARVKEDYSFFPENFCQFFEK